MSEKQLVTLTIDGQTIRAARGTLIIDAAKQIGIDIPHYCYHPGLSVVGSCRMCLVQIERNPKLQPSCATPVAEGMIVKTQVMEALKNRQGVLEFLLLNHPLDCPVCDQAGECELQNYYMDHGVYSSRLRENKTKRKKAFPIGKYVVLDQERCILCTRCVRFTQEISKTRELAVHDRGHRSEIDIYPGHELNNPYSGNVVDICPVGALTDRDFRFQCRVWFLGRTSSICPGCSRGCNVEVHYNERFNARYHDRRVHRLKPRYNPEVNGYWMCDEGRYAYHSIDAPNRIKEPRIKAVDGYQKASWREAIHKVAAALKSALEKYGPESVAVLPSPQMTNEELFQLRLLFRDSLKIGDIDYRVPRRDPVFSDDFLITADKNPNSRGAELIGLAGPGVPGILASCAGGRIRFLYICHHDLSLGFEPGEIAAALEKVDFVVFQGAWEQSTASMSNVQLPSAVYAEKEGTFTNVQGRVQKISAAVPPLGESLPDLDIIAQLAAGLNVPMPAVSAQEVFLEMARNIGAFRGMTYASVGDTGQLISQPPA